MNSTSTERAPSHTKPNTGRFGPERPSQANAVAALLDQWIHRRRAEFLFNGVRQHIVPGQTVLDLGAGDGLLAEYLHTRMSCPVHAYDIEERSLCSIPVKRYDGSHVPLDDRSVDVAICVTVLHHCPDPPAIVRELTRVARKRVIVVEDRYDSTLDRWIVRGFHRYLAWVEAMPYNDHGFHSRTEWNDIFAATGWRVQPATKLGIAIPFFPITNVQFVLNAP